jgi:hypothetical protein
MNYKDDDYILYIGDDANFQTRSMLIPIKQFLKVRQDDYNLLKQTSKHYQFKIDGIIYDIPQLLTINYIKEGNIGLQEVKENTLLLNHLTGYADGLDEDHYYDIKDKDWYDYTITNLCNGFNHIKNYTECCKINTVNNKNINIVDSFLCLSLENGRYQHCCYNTVEDMLKSLYCP